MSDTKTQGKTLNLNEKHYSDGSELIPAEVQAHIRYDEAQLADTASGVGYTIDDEGLINNFAVEPDMYPSEYPSPRQQRQYIVLGVSAILFVAMLMLVAFSVS
ncbi:photosystem II assembly protein Psb34 [Aerosakkonema sp. BLCC-F183]|uniref:photosystem II assembly protein Psb34 n=1 Tax=Aerosakkonema sp. BLCC-F183 TaxID=3342834 RepID=UPI0035B82FCE